MGCALEPFAERRAARRWPAVRLPWIACARIRPGRDIDLVNVSRGGALVETPTRLFPGTRVVVQLTGPERAVSLTATVLRCQVHAVDAGGVCYRGAVAFDEDLTVAEPGYLLPDLGRPGAS